jgi:hypothetical protein
VTLTDNLSLQQPSLRARYNNGLLLLLLLLLLAGTPIVGLKILNSNGDGELSDVIDAMNWLLETRPNGTSSEPNPGGKTNAQV